eukprot:s906_g4.t1
MVRHITVGHVLSTIIILSSTVFNCVEQDGKGMARKDADPLGRMDTDATDSTHFPGRMLLEDSSSQFDVAGMSTKSCHHQRDIEDLKKQLQVLRMQVIHGDSAAVKSLLDKWSRQDAYVHNLNSLPTADQDYPEIQCSDLDYLARHQVSYDEEPIYDNLYQVNDVHRVSYTMLELASHMTKGANQRALTIALNKHEGDVENQGERSEDRIRIVRLLLEKGFLWGSGDLVCKVVPPENGYHTEVREAFARTILYDLVKDPVHMNRTRINYLRQNCGGSGMNGVGWILGSVPGAFTLLGVLSQKTVLMVAARDHTNHDDAFINFPKLIDLHNALHVPVTTMDLEGWNAEMHAARVLNEEHVKLLKETTLAMWRQQYRDFFSIPVLGDFALDKLSEACIFLALYVNIVAYVFIGFFMVCFVIHFILYLCRQLRGKDTFDPLLPRLLQFQVFQHCTWSSVGVELLFRMIWLFTLNTAFRDFPPLAIIFLETHTLFGIPSVSIWNPLPSAVWFIVFVSLFWVMVFGLFDFLDVCQIADESPTSAFPRDAGKCATSEDSGPKPKDRFQDPSCHFIRCLGIFGLMTLLLLIYVKIVLQPMEMNPKRMGLWFGALLVQVKITSQGSNDTLSSKHRDNLLAFCNEESEEESQADSEEKMELFNQHSESQAESFARTSVPNLYDALWQAMHHWYRWAFCMGTPFNPEMWHLLMYAHKGNPEEMRIRNEDGLGGVQWSWSEITSRFVMSYFSNGLYKAIIVYTLPLWLSRGGLTDFVLNAFATVYIVDLDDVVDPKVWRSEPSLHLASEVVVVHYGTTADGPHRFLKWAVQTRSKMRPLRSADRRMPGQELRGSPRTTA